MVKFYALHVATVFFTTPASAYESKVERLPLVSPASIKRQLAARSLERRSSKKVKGAREKKVAGGLGLFTRVCDYLFFFSSLFFTLIQIISSVRMTSEGKTELLFHPQVLMTLSKGVQLAGVYDTNATLAKKLVPSLGLITAVIFVFLHILIKYILNDDNRVWDEDKKTKTLKEIVIKVAFLFLSLLAAVVVRLIPKKYFSFYGGKNYALHMVSKFIEDLAALLQGIQSIMLKHREHVSGWFSKQALCDFLVNLVILWVMTIFYGNKLTLENFQRLTAMISRAVIMVGLFLKDPKDEEK